MRPAKVESCQLSVLPDLYTRLARFLRLICIHSLPGKKIAVLGREEAAVLECLHRVGIDKRVNLVVEDRRLANSWRAVADIVVILIASHPGVRVPIMAEE